MNKQNLFTQNPTKLIIFFLTISIVLPNLCWGFTHIPNSGGDALESADLVVVARCVDSETIFQDGQILTLQTFEAQNYIKGYQGAYITVVQKGGSLGNVQMVVPGSTLIQEGQESVLYLTIQQDGLTSLIYPGANKAIFRDIYSGQRFVINSEDGGRFEVQQLDSFIRESTDKLNSYDFNEGQSLQIKEMGRLEYNEEIITEDNQ